jgi:DNA-binding transcriptional ArsR family regulator
MPIDFRIGWWQYCSVTIFAALAEPKRREILDLLRHGEQPAGMIVDQIGLAQPTVSQHLKMLREAGLVMVRIDGNRRVYRLRPAALLELDAWLEPYRQLWADRLDALEGHLDNPVAPDQPKGNTP